MNYARIGTTGFTLTEILVVVLCVGILLVPAISFLMQGTRSSLRGMVQIETVLEARRIMQQIRQDLKNACFPVDGKERDLTLSLYLEEKGEPPCSRYSFLSFSQVGKPEDAVPCSSAGTGMVWRRASKITYALEPSTKGSGNLLRLVREEKFHPDHPQATHYGDGTRISVLSDKVNLFHVQLHSFEPNSQLPPAYLVTLQLVDSVAEKRSGNGQPITLPDPSKTVIADFFDVVYSDFAIRMADRGWFNLNWQTGITGP